MHLARLLCGLLALAQLSVPLIAAPAPDTLTLGDLVGRPDRWPATVTGSANVRSPNGQTVQQGQRLPVANVTDKGVFVRTPSGGQIGLFPAQCDLLEQANARWAKLTPKQRALDAATVIQDSSLWPETVRLIHPTQVSVSGGGSRVLPAGHPCRFLYVQDGNVGVVPQGLSELKWFTADAVDLVGGALERVEIEPAKRPSHLAQSLRGIMRGADGQAHQADAIDQSEFFVFFWAANWCGWCQKVSPELSAFFNKHRAGLQHVTMVMMNGDKQESEMLKYLREKELPWPAVRMRDWTNVPYWSATHEGGYPQLLVTDAHGRIIYNGFGGGPENIRSHVAALASLVRGGSAGEVATSTQPASASAPNATAHEAGDERLTAPAAATPTTSAAIDRPTEARTAGPRAEPSPERAAAAPAAVTAPVEPLSWAQLVRRREAWPQQAALKREIRFGDGSVVQSGSPITILELKGNQVVASAKSNRGAVTFSVEADATDVIAAANSAWASLSAEQRELTFAALARRPDLWPYQLKLAVPIELTGAPAMRAGDTVLLLGYERNQLLVRIPKADIAFNIEPENTDLLSQARAFLASADGAPGRLLEEFAGKLVDPLTSRPASLDTAARPKYVVLYMGAGWCGPCKIFAPKLVQALKNKPPKAGEVALVYLSGDKTAAEAKRYVTDLGISWPMLSFTRRDQIPAFQSLFGNTIPQLVVTDRHGTVVIDSAKVGQDRALAQLRDLL